MSNVKEITIDGTKYVRADSIQTPALPGKRAVLVLDRGWIFAGDVTTDAATGRITLTRAVHVRSWESLGFDGMVANPKDSKVKLKTLSTSVNFPGDAELFRLPVSDDWGV